MTLELAVALYLHIQFSLLDEDKSNEMQIETSLLIL